jgi:hypothetical protein
MLPQWSAGALVKTKMTALIATSLAAGGVGGAVALSQVAPTTHVITRSAAVTDGADPATTDPETGQAGGGDPETGDAQGGGSDPETTDAGGGDPETTDAGGGGDPETGGSGGDPETGDAGGGDPGAYTLPPCPSDVKNHGAYVSYVARTAPKGSEHGYWVSQAARSDCGKKSHDGGGTDESGNGGAGNGQDGGSHHTKAPKDKTHKVKTPKAEGGADTGHGNGHGHGHSHG